MRVTVSHLKIAANTHFSRFSHLHRVLERCDLVRPLGHVSPHMCSLHASLVRRSPAERHTILCVGGGTFYSLCKHTVELLLLLCWQLRFFEFLCDAPGSALYVCCECGHNWVMCVGVKNHTLEMRALKNWSLGQKEWSAALL